MAPKTVVILIAVYSIFQGLVYGMLSVVALFSYRCKISNISSKASYFLYLVYFRDQRCGSYNWKLVSDVPHEPNWPLVSNVAFRAHILFSIYLVLSILLIGASFLLIVGCFISCVGRLSYYFFFLPWLVICGISIIFDVAALANFLYDLFNTIETDTFMKHLQIENTPNVHQAFNMNKQILWIPSVAMLLIAGRGFIFWCLNVISFNCVAIKARAIIRINQQFAQGRDAYNGSTFSENRFDRSFSPSGKSGSIKQMPYPTYPCSNSNCQRNWTPLRYSTSFDSSKQLTEPKTYRDHQNGSLKKPISTLSTPTNLLIADLSNPWREFDTTDSTNYRNGAQDLEMFEKPSKLKILSDSSYGFSESPSTFYPERDLADRVPWSYKRNRGDDVLKNKVKFEDFDKDEILPSITAPNYKLYFVQGENRPNRVINRNNGTSKQFIDTNRRKASDSDGHWSGPEYRY